MKKTFAFRPGGNTPDSVRRTIRTAVTRLEERKYVIDIDADGAKGNIKLHIYKPGESADEDPEHPLAILSVSNFANADPVIELSSTRARLPVVEKIVSEAVRENGGHIQKPVRSGRE